MSECPSELDIELTRYWLGVQELYLHDWAEGTSLYKRAGESRLPSEIAEHDGPAIVGGHFRRFQQDGTVVAYHLHTGYCDAYGPDDRPDEPVRPAA